MPIDPQHWPALSRLMDQMLDLPAGEREHFVRGLTGDDATFIPQLLGMLDKDTDSSGMALMETLPKLSDSALRTVSGFGAGYEDVGDEVGPYRLVRKIAQGGMGSVWYAERSDRLMRRGVALKLPLGSSRQLVARFGREREIVASLVHPNIARLYDAGISASGQAYLALEYVEGQSLDQYCDRNRLNVRARIALFGQVLGAVQYAHSRLVIHRDIKPSNILVTNEGEVRLLDFGVAKLLDPETTGPSELTQLADPGMTVAYASPEQVAGKPVTTATDVYSLGVVLFELLTGVRPYRTKRDTRGALEEAILQADIPLASALAGGTEEPQEVAEARATTLPKLRRELQGDIDSILIKALSRKPQERYETAAGFADDLVRYLEGRVVRAHRRSRWYQVQKFVGRNRVGVAVAAATAVALTTTTAVAIAQRNEAERQALVAASERDRALAAEANREAVDDFMSDLLLDADRTGKPLSVSALVTRAGELSARQFANDPELRAAVLRSVATLESEMTSPERALPIFRRALELVAGSQDRELRASLQCDVALFQGIQVTSAQEAQEAEQTLDKVAYDPQTATAAASKCLGNRAQLANHFRDGASGARAAREALALWERAPHHSQMRKLELLAFLATANYFLGEPAKAERGLAQVMGELKEIGRDRGELADGVLYYRTNAAISSGDPRLVLQLVDESIAMLARDFPDRPPPPVTLFQRCVALNKLGRYSEALDIYLRLARANDMDSALRGLALLGSAEALSRLGRGDAAEAAYAQAVASAGSAHGGGSGFEDERLLTRARLDLDRQHFAEVRKEMDAAIGRKRFAASTNIANARRLRGIAEMHMNDTDAALEDMRFCVAYFKKLRGDKRYSFDVGEAELILGQIQEKQGALLAARVAFFDSKEQLENSLGTSHTAALLAGWMLRDIDARMGTGHRAEAR